MGQAPCRNNPPTIILPAAATIMKEFIERKETLKDFKKLIHTAGTSYNESIHNILNIYRDKTTHYKYCDLNYRMVRFISRIDYLTFLICLFSV